MRNDTSYLDNNDLYELYNLNSDKENNGLKSNRQRKAHEREEKMFLKVSVYQIFTDKIMDLLAVKNTKNAGNRVFIDHYLD